MNRYSWHTSSEKDDGGWYRCNAEIKLRTIAMSFKEWPYYRPCMKGGHTHNHVKNAHKRMKHCVICDKPITKYEGFSSRFTGHICMECYIEECREHAVMAGIPTIGSLFDDLRNPFIRCK